jgi:hypothetical protein
MMTTTTEPPFWRLPAAAATAAGSTTTRSTSTSYSPPENIVVTPTTLLPPAFLALRAGNAYSSSTAIVETSSGVSAAAEGPPVSACHPFYRTAGGSSCSSAAAIAATTTTTTTPPAGSCLLEGGPRWTDRRNLTQVQETELQDKIRRLVAECEKKNVGGLMVSHMKKKKLLLEGMSLSEADIPVEDILLGVDYGDKYNQTGTTCSRISSTSVVAPQWIKAAQAASKNNKGGGGGASKGLDSYGTQATTASAVSVLSNPEGNSTSTSNKKSGSSSSSSLSVPLAKKLHSLSLSRNRYLVTIPQKLVSGSMVSGAKLLLLQHLDLSSCAICKLPDERMWDLPQLKTLNVALNRLQDFPNQVCCFYYSLLRTRHLSLTLSAPI